MIKDLIIIILVTIFIIFTFILFTNRYLFKLIKFGYADVDDYKISYNDTIKNYYKIEWKLTKDYNKKEISHDLLSQIIENQTIALLIIQDGKIKYEKYFHNYSEDSLINSFSVSKSIISILVGIAIDEGKIKSVNQKVCDYFPNFGEKLTIKDLLTMSSDFDWSEKFKNPFSDVVEAYYTEDLRKLVFSKKVKNSPGKIWQYQCINTQLLAYILEKATNQKVTEYCSQKLWTKIGAQSKALWSLDDKDKDIKAFCCFYATPRDFARLGILILNKGYFDDVSILSEQYVNQATTAASYLINTKGDNITNYGYHFWLYNYNGFEIPYFRGMYGQYIFAIPNKNAVVVRLGRRGKENNFHATSKKAEIYLNAAFEILD